MEEVQEKRQVKLWRKRIVAANSLNILVVLMSNAGNKIWGDTRWWLFVAVGGVVYIFLSLFYILYAQKKIIRLQGVGDGLLGNKKILFVFVAIVFVFALLGVAAALVMR